MQKCICPNCKSNNVIPIVYGFPAPSAMEEADKGNVKLGGCLVYDIDGCGMADRYCKDCEHEWCVDDFGVEDIIKVRFRYWSNWGAYYSEKEDQWAFEISPDGTIKYFSYPMKGRKVLDKDEVHIEKERVADFYQNVIWLYRPWTEIVDYQVCDGCSYELTITYKDNRKKKLHGDLGGGTVDETVMSFLRKIPEMKEHIEGEDE
jgi:hypothetical protein